MRQPSLYTYFPAKHAIYDAMFAQGWQAWVDRLNRLELPADVPAGTPPSSVGGPCQDANQPKGTCQSAQPK